MRHDPGAQVLMLPADHFFEDERVLCQAMEHAMRHVRAMPQHLVLLGMPATMADPELGYIVPGLENASGSFPVLEFVEKPADVLARALVARGALWNAFIIAAQASTVLALFEQEVPDLLAAMRRVVHAEVEVGTPASMHTAAQLDSLYERLPHVDFSREIIAAAPPQVLRVVPVRVCGWSDLGTPERIGRTLAQVPGGGPAVPARTRATTATLNLATRYRRAPASLFNR
jgi:mannose-1-phosphate guanylyltransferase